MKLFIHVDTAFGFSMITGVLAVVNLKKEKVAQSFSDFD
jgi:hypothetical protein